MVIIKRLDRYILKNFLTLFAGTFCISLFVVMMQFLWKYVDELVGKGLDLVALAKFFFYAGETLVPMSLPLAVLLASLISFGNLGERLELLSIKAAGISLIRTLCPLVVFVGMLSGISFYFQDVVAPQAQRDFNQLLYSIRESTPELEIPEGVFYDGIAGINLYVKQKDKDTGLLREIVIYDMREGVDNAHIILADSARLITSADKRFLNLYLYSGEQFENLRTQVLKTNNIPYRRETFVEKHVIIDFDTNLNMADSEMFSSAATTKSMERLLADLDSIHHESDSLGRAYYTEMRLGALHVQNLNAQVRNANDADNADRDIVGFEKPQVSGYKEILAEAFGYDEEPASEENSEAQEDATSSRLAEVELISIDSLTVPQRINVVRDALQKVNSCRYDLDFKTEIMESNMHNARLHELNIWKKITLSLACLLFFFIGAPLGAIIRKGGLGLPVVVAVIFFIVYYMIDTGATKLGRNGTIPVWLGMWMSTIVLAPLGAFFTIKSNNDSVVFNMDAYKAFFRKVLGIRQRRHMTKKEVIINDPDYISLVPRFAQLAALSRQYRKANPRMLQIKLVWFILQNRKDEALRNISDLLEDCVEELSNTKDRHLLIQLNMLPVLNLEPRFHNRLRRDMKAIYETSDKIVKRIEEMNAGR